MLFKTFIIIVFVNVKLVWYVNGLSISASYDSGNTRSAGLISIGELQVISRAFILPAIINSSEVTCEVCCANHQHIAVGNAVIRSRDGRLHGFQSLSSPLAYFLGIITHGQLQQLKYAAVRVGIPLVQQVLTNLVDEILVRACDDRVIRLVRIVWVVRIIGIIRVIGIVWIFIRQRVLLVHTADS